MNILKTEKGKGVVVELNCSELNELDNALYHFIEYAVKELNSNKTANISLSKTTYELKSEIGLARDLSHYGHLDKFSRESFEKYYRYGQVKYPPTPVKVEGEFSDD